MYRVRQEDLPFQGSSHQFVEAEHGDVTISVFLLSALPVNFLLSALCCSFMQTATQSGADSVEVNATQLVVVTTTGWDSTTGELRRFVRADVHSPWRSAGNAVPIVVGRTGLAWGVEFDRFAAAGTPTAGPRKREGDGRSPAGIFPLTTVFGFAPADSMQWVPLPYLPLTPSTECVDDTSSVHYNTVVDRRAVTRVDWQSAEHMRQIAQYRLGVIIGYNATPPVKARGSCIFFHIWGGPRSSTVGCTALDAVELAQLVAWLDPRARPVVVQVPAAVYPHVRAAWGLPTLNR
jgi:D-alanyl-D-alanine dipeptidase